MLATLATGSLVGTSFFACGPRELPVTATRPALAVEDASAPPVDEPSPYTLAPWGSGATDTLSLGKSELGLLVDGVRVVASGSHMRVSSEVATSALTAVSEVPRRLGGGYLFHNETSIYHSDRFDGKLRALAYFPEGKIHSIQFGFERLLVRSSDGQRWMIKLSGERVALEPPGLAELSARDDGLGLVMTDTGRLHATHDAGKSWRDVTSQLRGAPASLETREDAIYVSSQEDTSARLEPDGRLGRVDSIPAAPLPQRDPRWRSGEAPLRFAVRAGVPAEDDGVALVANAGDLFRISLRNGDIVSVQSGKVPLDAQCEPVRTPEDVLILCTRHGSNAERFVISGTLFGKTPQIEQSFPGIQPFYVGDDGAIAFGGPCSGPPREGVACVRSGQGSWLERSAASDGGTATALSYVVPRIDGTAVALALQAKPPTITDLVTGEVRTFAESDFPGSISRYGGGKFGGVMAIHREWSFAPDGSLRGWQGGRSITIPSSGAPTSSSFVGDSAIYGQNGTRALGMNADGRLFQTLDRGLTWGEIAPPPSHATGLGAKRAIGSLQCGTVGCLLGPWLRIGYRDDPPKPPLRKIEVPPPTEAASFAKAKTVACDSTGALRGRVVPTGDRDAGLGATFLPTGVDAMQFARGSLHPVNGGDGGGDGDEASKRGISYTSANNSAATFRHTFAYVLPFDPQATIRSGVLVASDVAQALRGSQVSLEDILSELSFSRAVPTTPLDPAAPGGLLFSSERGMVLFRGGGPRFALMPEDTSLTPISAAELPGDDLLVLTSNGSQSVVQKLSKGGALTQVFEWKGPQDTERYPSNPDAIATGPRGEIGVIRTSSGNEPASTEDPARLIQAKGKETKLAPWSTLALADDPACKSDPSGFRATVQLTSEWAHFENVEDKSDTPAPIFARVRWSETRVCLEGLEMRTRSTEGEKREAGRKFEQWAVSRTFPQNQAARIAIGAGFDFRQPAKCVIR